MLYKLNNKVCLQNYTKVQRSYDLLKIGHNTVSAKCYTIWASIPYNSYQGPIMSTIYIPAPSKHHKSHEKAIPYSSYLALCPN